MDLALAPLVQAAKYIVSPSEILWASPALILSIIVCQSCFIISKSTGSKLCKTDFMIGKSFLSISSLYK